MWDLDDYNGMGLINWSSGGVVRNEVRFESDLKMVRVTRPSTRRSADPPSTSRAAVGARG